MGNNSDATNYPLKDIIVPHAHDVLCGRGGLSNNHVGNTHWRMLIAANKSLYVTLRKPHKILLSKSIVAAIRGQSPPGRFLQKDANLETWYDIGDHKAQEKTSQALREGAPDIRSQIRTETGGAANDPYLTAQSYIPPNGSSPDAIYPQLNAGPYSCMVSTATVARPYMAYPLMYMHPRVPPPYYPPHMPPAQYSDPRQIYPNASPPQVPFSAPETTIDKTLKLPSLDTVPSPAENKTAAEMTEKQDACEKPDIALSDGQEPLEFARLETLRLESMGISSFGTKLEPAGTSFGRMSFSILPDPDGLETFASLSIQETPPRRSPLTKRAKQLRSEQRSPGGLLEDSEDEGESGATTNTTNKAADWEKMRALFDLRQHDKTTAAAAAPVDNIPVALLDADISSGAVSTFSIFSARGTHDEISAPVPSSSPPRSTDNLSEREKLEMEYLNRGVSLACENFGVNTTK